MKLSLGLVALLTVAIPVLAEESDTWETEAPRLDEEALLNVVSASDQVPVMSNAKPANNQILRYVPLPKRTIDRDNNFLVPQKSVSLHYTEDYTEDNHMDVTDDGHMDVNHIMKYPTILLEQIASIIKVECTAGSVAVTFDDTGVFEEAQSVWNSKRDEIIVLVTNNAGDCNSEHERGFFLATNVEFNLSTLVATATSTRADLATIADYTEIAFGHITAAAPDATAKRAKVSVDMIHSTLSLPENTLLYKDSYVTTVAENVSFTSQVTFSGSLKYNWFRRQLKELYFDIDAGFTVDLALSSSVQAASETTFTYDLPPLYYGLVVPGVLELGPMLQFTTGAEISTSGAATLSTDLQISHVSGKIHIDVLASGKTTVSGGTPTSSFNSMAAVTFMISARLFGKLIDLSGGTTATTKFNNKFDSTSSIGADLDDRNTTTNADAKCNNGLGVESDFAFAIDAFAPRWYSANIYQLSMPLLDKCYLGE
ncbi:hypothetical protein BUE80_DR011523 [Diplocarpon rosae]|nr:hypothetical protein BUE80_DR011523 [Diplocarpon rosae]